MYKTHPSSKEMKCKNLKNISQPTLFYYVPGLIHRGCYLNAKKTYMQAFQLSVHLLLRFQTIFSKIGQYLIVYHISLFKGECMLI